MLPEVLQLFHAASDFGFGKALKALESVDTTHLDAFTPAVCPASADSCFQSTQPEQRRERKKERLLTLKPIKYTGGKNL